jgi:hypothetical protein
LSEETLPHEQGQLVRRAHARQRDGFEHDLVSGDENVGQILPFESPECLLRALMVAIPEREEREEEPRIDEYHSRP